MFVSALPLSAACAFLPPQCRSDLWCSLGIVHLSLLWVSTAVVVCVAIAKWSQRAASVCACVSFLLSVWPLQSGHRVQQFVCACVRLSQPSTPSLQHRRALCLPFCPGVASRHVRDRSSALPVDLPAAVPFAALHSVVLVGHWLPAGACVRSPQLFWSGADGQPLVNPAAPLR